MATLAEAFLADLEDLSDGDVSQEQEEDEEHEHEQGEDDEMGDVETLNYDDLSAVAKLSSEARYKKIMSDVRSAMEASTSGGQEAEPFRGPLEDDPTYKLLVDCNKLAVDIDNEIALVHGFIRDKYRPCFPELESLVHHPIDYARVVKRIGNVIDLTVVALDDLLPAATVMVVTVTATTTSGKPLSEENLAKAVAGCDMALALDADKATILRFVEGKMHKIAPNLSEVVGPEVAAKLMGVAGGLVALSKMPACNVQVLGQRKKSLVGLSSATVLPHQGFVWGAPVIAATPPGLRPRAVRLAAAKCTLMARVDAYGQDPSGGAGQAMKAEVMRKIEKWQEPPPAKTAKPLPVPDAVQKKRRGGRRLRKMKERYGLTDVRKAANRVNFNQPEEEIVDFDDMVGLGTLGSKEGTGRLRVIAGQQKMKLSAAAAKKFGKQQQQRGGAVNGLSSSLAFTPVQGIELTNPQALASSEDIRRSGTESYFSSASGFRSLTAKPRG